VSAAPYREVEPEPEPMPVFAHPACAVIAI
jgi:hypothetical protein